MDGRVWMVAGAAPGDEVLARVVHDRGRFVEAVAATVERPSPRRRDAPCAIQSTCGGCPLMVVDEDDQREAKRRILVDALARIGRLPGILVHPVAPSPRALGYRNRIELTLGRDGSGRTVLGYHAAAEPERLVDVASCLLAEPALAPLVAAARAYFLDGTADEEPLRLGLRASSARNERLAVIRSTNAPSARAAAFARCAAEQDPGLVGVAWLVGREGRRGGARTLVVAGRPWIEDVILGTAFRVPAGTFVQVNPQAAEVLGRALLEGAAGAGSVLELYGGVGGFGIAYARRGAGVVVVEADPEAVACGEEAARRAGIGAIRFVRADAGRYLAGAAAGPAPDLLLADPPRSGLAPEVLARIGAWGPRRVAMVSCDPATLARDLARLVGHGYTVEGVTPFDLFPQTAHVEALAWLRR